MFLVLVLVVVAFVRNFKLHYTYNKEKMKKREKKKIYIITNYYIIFKKKIIIIIIIYFNKNLTLRMLIEIRNMKSEMKRNIEMKKKEIGLGKKGEIMPID